jgi:Nuclease-related domain
MDGADIAPVPWRDLAGNKAGTMAGARADELRSQAPVWSFVSRLLAVRTEERDFRVGASGEAEVAWRLRKLGPPGWHVIHSVPVGNAGSDIDHVVIGPAGVFTVNTKHHRAGRVWVAEGTVMVNGRETWYVRNARFEAARAARMLSAGCGLPVVVRPVIVVVGARLTIRQRPVDVAVLDARAFVRWLRRQPATLPPDKVERIFEVARRDTTWRTVRR